MWIGSAPSSSTTDSINSSPNQRDEDNTTIFSPTWEENYQDLSGWCSRIPMDHSSYSFPVGESLNRGHSGMKINDKTYSTNVGVVIDVGVTSASTVAFDEFKQQSYNNNNNINNNNNNNDSNNINNNINNHNNNNNINNNQIVTILPPIDDEKPEIIGGSIDVPDEWLDLPKSSIALRTDEWIRLVDNEKVDEPLQRIEIDGINDNFDNSSPVEPTVNWDIISTFDNNEKDNFDLLSYLCDDNIRSPESISTDSVDIYQASTSYDPQNNDKILRLHNTRQSRRSYKSENPSLIKNSSDLHDVKPSKSLLKSLVAPPSPSASSSSGGRLKTARTKTRTTKAIKTRMKKEEISSDEKRGRKRQYDSDSDDASSDFSYRESREKNNEASRKSRMNKKAKEREMMSKAVGLEKNNRVLKAKVEQLEKMVMTMRNAILQSALRRNV